VSVEIGIQTHSNCSKNKNVQNFFHVLFGGDRGRKPGRIGGGRGTGGGRGKCGKRERNA